MRPDATPGYVYQAIEGQDFTAVSGRSGLVGRRRR